MIFLTTLRARLLYRDSRTTTAGVIHGGESNIIYNFVHCCWNRKIGLRAVSKNFEPVGANVAIKAENISSIHRNPEVERPLSVYEDPIVDSIRKIKLFDQPTVISAVSEDHGFNEVDDFERGSSQKYLYIRSQLFQTYNIISISVDSAEARFNLLYEYDREMVLGLVRPGILNEFIKFHLEKGDNCSLLKARVWYSRFDEFNLKRDVDTYFLFLSHYIKNGMHMHAKDLLNDMRREDPSTIALFKGLLERNPDLLEYLGEDFSWEELFSSKELKVLLDSGVDLPLHHPTSSNPKLPSIDATTPKNAGVPYTSPPSPQFTLLKCSNPDKGTSVTDLISKLFKSLKNFSCDSPWGQQVYIESASHLAAQERLLESPLKSISLLTNNKDIKNIVNAWIFTLTKAIEAEVAKFEPTSSTSQDAIVILFFVLKHIKIEDVARVSVKSLLYLISNHSLKGADMHNDIRQIRYTSAARIIGTSIKDAVRVYNVSTSHSGLGLRVRKALSNISDYGLLVDGRVRRRLAKMDKLVNGSGELAFSWTSLIVLRLGAFILDMIIDNLCVDPEQIPSGQITSRADNNEMLLRHAIMKDRSGSKSFGYIIVNDSFLPKLHSSPIVQSINLPMLTRPVPWTSIDNGGYISNNRNIMLNPCIDSMKALRLSYKSGALDEVLRAIDILSSVPWVINEGVLKVAMHFYSTAKPNDNNTFSNARTPPGLSHTYLSKEGRKIQSEFSKELEVEYKISIAKGLLGRTFYYPYNIDFRGRAYPASSYLNHTSDDFSRGLLMFGVKKRLGERGLYWLKIQIASHAGKSRLNFDEKLKYTEDNLVNVLSSARNPKAPDSWWTQFEDKWQLLSCCIELRNAIESGNPESYETGIHVHKDGTCNGIQHYAALSRDVALGKLVNLIDQDRPNDVYSCVLDGLVCRINNDIRKGDPLALVAIKFADRKLIKQTVMTVPYGVTHYGAVQQIDDKISEEDLKKVIDSIECLKDSKKDVSYFKRRLPIYIARLALEAIEEIYCSAVNVQQWLMLCAEKVSKSVLRSDMSEKELKKMELLQKLGYIEGDPLPDPEDSSSDTCSNRTYPTHGNSEHATSSNIPDCSSDSPPYSFPPEETRTPLCREWAHNHRSADIFSENSAMFRETRFGGNTSTCSHGYSAYYEQNLINPGRKEASPSCKAVKWTTPLGLPVIQPYRSTDNERVLISTRNQTITCRNIASGRNKRAPSRTQVTSFPPNFIHSLDATHMMLTAIACNENNIAFASVHDSYWTHPSDVDILDKSIAHSFVRLHSIDILGNLRRELKANFRHHCCVDKVVVKDPEHLKDIASLFDLKSLKSNDPNGGSVTLTVHVPFNIEPPPEKKSLDINSVLNSKYFFN